MPLFSHVIAEHCCTRCKHRRPDTTPTLAGFDLIVSGVAAVPFWVVSLRAPWNFPWYYVVSIYAGELLLIFIAGFLTSFVMIPLTAIKHWKDRRGCRICGAPMRFVGRHFDPAGSRYPHWSDMVIFSVFVGLNFALWIALFQNSPR